MSTNVKKLCGVVVFFIGILAAKAQTADAILGQWENPGKEKQIEFRKTDDGHYEAVALKEGQPTIIKNLSYRDNAYTGGKVYIPEKDTWLDCTVKLEGKNTLLLTGKRGWFSKTKKWTRL
ncbi:DUF2147 domain-containing protein [Sinomicrobium sp. M5D2P17]